MGITCPYGVLTMERQEGSAQESVLIGMESTACYHVNCLKYCAFIFRHRDFEVITVEDMYYLPKLVGNNLLPSVCLL